MAMALGLNVVESSAVPTLRPLLQAARTLTASANLLTSHLGCVKITITGFFGLSGQCCEWATDALFE
jgi:hypothetical protein